MYHSPLAFNTWMQEQEKMLSSFTEEDKHFNLEENLDLLEQIMYEFKSSTMKNRQASVSNLNQVALDLSKVDCVE